MKTYEVKAYIATAEDYGVDRCIVCATSKKQARKEAIKLISQTAIVSRIISCEERS